MCGQITTPYINSSRITGKYCIFHNYMAIIHYAQYVSTIITIILIIISIPFTKSIIYKFDIIHLYFPRYTHTRIIPCLITLYCNICQYCITINASSTFVFKRIIIFKFYIIQY